MSEDWRLGAVTQKSTVKKIQSKQYYFFNNRGYDKDTTRTVNEVHKSPDFDNPGKAAWTNIHFPLTQDLYAEVEGLRIRF